MKCRYPNTGTGSISLCWCSSPEAPSNGHDSAPRCDGYNSDMFSFWSQPVTREVDCCVNTGADADSSQTRTGEHNACHGARMKWGISGENPRLLCSRFCMQRNKQLLRTVHRGGFISHLLHVGSHGLHSELDALYFTVNAVSSRCTGMSSYVNASEQRNVAPVMCCPCNKGDKHATIPANLICIRSCRSAAATGRNRTKCQIPQAREDGVFHCWRTNLLQPTDAHRVHAWHSIERAWL
jgi:hypothetical protein